MDKNKGRPTSLPMRRVNRQVQNWAIRLKNSAFGVSNLSFCLCLLLIFFLYARHLFICEIIEFDLLGNILSDEFITRISDEAKKNARYENVPCVKPYIMSDVQIIVIRLGLEPKTHTLKVYCSTS